MIAPGGACKVINQEDVTHTIGWDNIEYLLPPHEEVVVSADAVINAFGDPRSKDEMYSVTMANGVTGWVPDRPSEVRRLRSKWGNHDGPEDTVIAPTVEVFTLTGEKVTTVIDDPKGETVNPALITQANERHLQDIVKQQQAQLDELMRLVGDGVNQTVALESQLPVDDSDERQIKPFKATPKPDLRNYDND